MKSIKRGMKLLLFMLIFFLIAMPVQAKTLQAKTYTLKNVKKAEYPNGEWVTSNSVTRFVRTNGKVIKNRWIRVEEKIYYVGKTGARAEGTWIKYRNKYYYVNKKGEMCTGWRTMGGKRYYLKSNGVRSSGLTQIDGDTYFFNKKTGVLGTGWITVGKYQYYFAEKKGKLQTARWINTKGNYYYVDADGRKMKSCWLTLGDKKYYLRADGARVSGTLFLDGKGYYFDKNGVYDPKVEVKMEVDPTKKMVALTFDDGPGAYTDRLLECLEKNDAKATFFLVGTGINRYKSTVKRIADLGCELGNHSYDHPAFTSLSNSAIQSQIQRTSSLIRQAAGVNPTVARLPYGDGASNSRVLGAIGLPSIYWSIDTMDWANTGNPQHTVNEVLNYVKNGDIVLMHDIHRATVIAAEQIIPALKSRGYQLVTVSQLAKYKGKTTLKSGTTYRKF